MVLTPRLICVVDADIRRGRCKYCNADIVWATTASERGKPSRTLPFTAPRPFPVRTEHNESGLAFEYWPTAALHVVSCPKQPKRQPKSVFHRRRR